MPMPKIGSISLAGWAAFFLLVFPGALFAQPGASPASFETLAAKAGAAREAGQTEEAIRNYRAAVELRPAWDEGLWYLGTLLYDSDHFEEAIPRLRRLVTQQPKAGPAWAFLGLSEFETGDYRDSLVSLRAAHEIGFSEDPDIGKVALYHLGLLLNLHGQFDEATDLLAGAFGPSHFTIQIKSALGLAFLRAPILPAQLDPGKDALVRAAGETAVLLANHQIDAALRNIEQMLRDFPDTPYLHYRYGLTLAVASRYPEAELQLREESRITTTSAAVYGALAQTLQAQSKREDADTVSRKAQELSQHLDGIEAAQVTRYSLNRGATLKSSVAHDATSGTTPKGTFDELARRAESERRAGRMERAAAAYRDALTLNPGWAEGWRQLGTTAFMRGQYPDAVSALQQSVALETKLPDTWTLLGLSEFETKDYKNALIHLERGRALGFSGNAAAVRISRYHLALLLNLNGDFDRAIDVLLNETGPGDLAEEIRFAMGISVLRIRVLPEQVSGDQVVLVRRTGEAAAFLAESRYDKALPMVEKLVNDYPNTPFLHYAYGDALAATSMYYEAQVQLREEVRLNPQSPLPYIRMASIALQQRQSEGALEASKKAVSLAPESSEAHYLLGRSFLEQGDIPAAIRELEMARGYEPNSPKVHFNLARAYAKAERSAEAEQERAEFERLNAQLPGQQNRSANGYAARPNEVSKPEL